MQVKKNDRNISSDDFAVRQDNSLRGVIIFFRKILNIVLIYLLHKLYDHFRLEALNGKWLQKNPTTNEYLTLYQSPRAVYMHSKMATLSSNTSQISFFNLAKEEEAPMNELFCFQ